jgi:23S rRNA (adenine-N6)-dimethyltransferase
MKARARPKLTERDVRRRTHSQNFLRSHGLVRTLVRDAKVGADDIVIEPGAGTGVITAELAKRARRVVAIELDPDWARRLEERFADVPNVEVRHEDFFEYGLPRAAYRVFANIPLGVTTRLLRHLLHDPRRAPARADLIVQLEVARKHSRARAPNALTASWQPWYELELVRRIPAQAFRPVPRVDAALLAITKRTEPLLEPAERGAFAAFVDAAFAGRTVWEGLRRVLTANQVKQLRRHSGLPADAAPASLTVADWVALYEGARRFGP